MTKKELKKAVTIDSLRNQVADLNGLEKVYNVFGRLVTTPIEYRFVADAMIRGYLRNIGREKKWTWFDDLAVSEWFVANGTEPNAVLDTCAHAMKFWHESAESMAEFLFALSLKCNEHYERERTKTGPPITPVCSIIAATLSMNTTRMMMSGRVLFGDTSTDLFLARLAVLLCLRWASLHRTKRNPFWGLKTKQQYKFIHHENKRFNIENHGIYIPLVT